MAFMKRLFPLLCLFLTLPALAQQAYLVKFSSGTGFFINKQGHLVTNAHVVRGCRSVLRARHRSPPA